MLFLLIKVKYRYTLDAIFATPMRAGIVFSDIEALVTTIGGEVRQGSYCSKSFREKPEPMGCRGAWQGCSHPLTCSCWIYHPIVKWAGSWWDKGLKEFVKGPIPDRNYSGIQYPLPAFISPAETPEQKKGKKGILKEMDKFMSQDV